MRSTNGCRHLCLQHLSKHATKSCPVFALGSFLVVQNYNKLLNFYQWMLYIKKTLTENQMKFRSVMSFSIWVISHLFRMSKHLKSVARIESCGIGCSYNISTVEISEFTCSMKIQNLVIFYQLGVHSSHFACKLPKLSRPDVRNQNISRTCVA